MNQDATAMEVETIEGECNSSSSSSHYDGAQLDRQLNEAEEAICEIMRTTKSTLDELQNVPNCNMERLKSLAGNFVGKISKCIYEHLLLTFMYPIY